MINSILPKASYSDHNVYPMYTYKGESTKPKILYILLVIFETKYGRNSCFLTPGYSYYRLFLPIFPAHIKYFVFIMNFLRLFLTRGFSYLSVILNHYGVRIQTLLVHSIGGFYYRFVSFCSGTSII